MRIPNTDCKNCKNNNCLIKQLETASLINQVNEHKRTILLQGGQNIISEGLPFEDITFIYEGQVKVYKQGYNNKVQVVRLSKAGDVIGHRALYRENTPITAQTIAPSKICFVPKTIFMNCIDQDIQFSNALMKLFADDLFHSEELTRNHAQMSVRELVADTLIRLYNTYGINEKNEAIDVILTRQEIAEIAGTTKEQVSKFLYEFKKDGLIEIKGKQIIPLAMDSLVKLNAHFGHY